jgi:hypothetical protein
MIKIRYFSNVFSIQFDNRNLTVSKEIQAFQKLSVPDSLKIKLFAQKECSPQPTKMDTSSGNLE